MLSLDITHTQQCLFQASFLSRVNFPPKLTIPSRQTDAKLSSLNLFFFRLGQWITNISRKLSFNGQQTQKILVLKQSKGCRFMPKMQQIRLAAETSCWRAYALSNLYSRSAGDLLLGGLKGRKEWERERKGEGGGGNSPKVNVSRINSAHPVSISVPRQSPSPPVYRVILARLRTNAFRCIYLPFNGSAAMVCYKSACHWLTAVP